MINYSIIIPYRDKYDMLLKAVKSVPDREDIQIIIIDNSNTPLAEGKIPHKNNANVLFLTSDPTLGAGRARNEGLKHVEGRWLLFLDADDYFTTEAFPAFDKYMDEDYCIVFFNPTSIKLNNGQEAKRHVNYANKVAHYFKTGEEEWLRYRWEVPWSKLFKSSFVLSGGFTFDELRVSNDAWFSLMTGHAAKKITADKTTVYVVTAGENGSSLTRQKSKENWFTRFQVMVRINQFLKSVGKYDYHIRLLGGLRIAWRDFGFHEFIHFLKYASDNNVGIF